MAAGSPHPISSRLCLERFSPALPQQEDRLGLSFLSLSPMQSALEEDRLAIAMCSPVRRLQQKTQVFPLDVKASSRSRLTHSLEVAAFARVLTLGLGKCSAFFAEHREALLTCLHNAALLHDVGNPPFGHFGEEVIRNFLQQMCLELRAQLSSAQITDLCNFNGNAQGLRLIHSLQGMNLTFLQLAAVLKVPFSAAELCEQGITDRAYINAHAGVFLSELPLIARMRECGCLEGRHFLAALLELADDLAYTLADLEDACDRGLVQIAEIQELLMSSADWPDKAACACRSASALLRTLRCMLTAEIGADLQAAVGRDPQAFIERGELDWGREHPGYALLGQLKDYALRRIYHHPQLGALELSGAHYLNTLLGCYRELLLVSREQFKELFEDRGGSGLQLRLVRRISRRHREAYARYAQGDAELYFRMRMLVDYISGMTDSYARAEYCLLTGQG